ALTIGTRRGGTVPTAQVFQQPGARWHLDIPHLLAVLGAVAGDVMFGELRLSDAFGPINHDEEDAILPNDETRLIVIEPHHVMRTRQRRLPEDVGTVNAAPGERQIVAVGDAHPTGAAPAG